MNAVAAEVGVMIPGYADNQKLHSVKIGPLRFPDPDP